MVRTQIQLPEEDYERLKLAASRQGRSMADCIREGIGLFLRQVDQGRRDLLAIPAFLPGAMDDLKEHDRWWAEAALDEP